MKNAVSASAGYPLGEVDSCWHPPELNRDFAAEIGYQSHDDEGRMTYPQSGRLTIDLLGQEEVTGEVASLVVESGRTVVSALDSMVREYRGYSPDVVTQVDFTYRVGLGRNSGLLGRPLNVVQSLIRLPWRFVPPGSAHFDRYGLADNRPEKDIATLAHQGKHTVIYEGVIWEPYMSRNFGNGKLNLLRRAATVRPLSVAGRLSATRRTAYPPDTAVLIDEHTLHSRPGEVYRTSTPPVFARASITSAKNV